MRKISFLAAIAAVVTLGACSNDAELGTTGATKEKEIGFRSFIDKGNNTRATVTTSGNILNFTLTGWWDRTNKISGTGLNDGIANDKEVAEAVANAMTNGNTVENEYLFNAVDITRRETGFSDWEYSPKRYWPADDIIGGGVAFFAYSPASSQNVSQGIKGYEGGKLTYTVPNPDKSTAREKAQEDFLLARTNPRNTDGTVKNDGDVNLNFVHALSRVKFFARTSNTNVTYIIGGVELVNLAMTGSIDLKNIPANGEITYPDTQGSDPVTIWDELGIKDGVIGLDMGESPINLLGISTTEPNKYHSLHGESAALMVMPQTTELGAIDRDDESKNAGFLLKISYKAYLNNPNTDTYFAGDKDNYENIYYQVVDNIRKDGNDTKSLSFEMGRQYNFCIQFGSEAGEEVTFKVNVGSWEAADTITL